MLATRTITLVGAVALALALAVGPALAGGGGGGGACPAFADGDTTTIVLRDSCFAPVSATAPTGGTLTVRNEGELPHTYTALDASFDTGVLAPGGSASLDLPDAPGTLPAYCTLHASRDGDGMAGTLTLVAADDGATTVTSAGIGSSALSLAGGFVLGTATLTAIRRRRGHGRERL